MRLKGGDGIPSYDIEDEFHLIREFDIWKRGTLKGGRGSGGQSPLGFS